MKNLLHFLKKTHIFIILILFTAFTSDLMSNEKLTPFDSVRIKYNKGQIKEARDEINNYINEKYNSLNSKNITSKQARILLIKLTKTVKIASALELLHIGSLNETNVLRNSSIEYISSLIETMDACNNIANKIGAYKCNSTHENSEINYIIDARISSVIDFIKLSKKYNRENIFKKYKTFLESKGITMESIESPSEEEAKEKKKNAQIKIAEEEIDGIRSTLKKYYDSLLTGDFTSNRALFSEKNTDKDLKKFEEKYKHERDVEKDFDSLESIKFDDKTIVKVVNAKDDYVVVRVKNVILSLKKDDKTINAHISDKFKMLKEDNKWVIWKN